MAFTYAGKVIESTFGPYDEDELSQKVPGDSGPTKVQIGGSQYDASTMKLTDGPRPAVGLIILKSGDDSAGMQSRESRLLLQFVEVELAILIVLGMLAAVALQPENKARLA